MLSSLLRPRKARYNRILNRSSPFADETSPILGQKDKIRHAAADWTETEDNEDYILGYEEDGDYEADGQIDTNEANNEVNDFDFGHQEPENSDDDEDGHRDGRESPPLLPIFSAAHLGILRVSSHSFQTMLIQDRWPASLPHHTCYSTHRQFPM